MGVQIENENAIQPIVLLFTLVFVLRVPPVQYVCTVCMYVCKPIETENVSNRSKQKHSQNSKKLGQVRILGPEDLSNIETEIPSHVESKIESIEPSPTLFKQLEAPRSGSAFFWLEVKEAGCKLRGSGNRFRPIATISAHHEHMSC